MTRHTGDILDKDGNGLDDRLHLWLRAIAKRVGYVPKITDTLRSYEQQARYHRAGYGARPEGAPHVAGRAMDLRTRDSGIPLAQWRVIAQQAAEDAGLKGVRAITHVGTAAHLHLEVGSHPHAPDNCPSCVGTDKTFIASRDAATARAPRGQLAMASEPRPRPALSTDPPGPGPTRVMPIVAQRQPLGIRVAALGSPPIVPIAYAAAGGGDHAAFTRVLRTAPGSPRELVPADEGDKGESVLPTKLAARNYAGMVGRRGQPITLGENRLALHGETRAALFRHLIDQGGGKLTLQDLKLVKNWGPDKKPFKDAIDSFIADKKLDAGEIYRMLAQSERRLKRKDGALFAGATAPLTLEETFGRAHALERGRRASAPEPAAPKRRQPESCA